MFNPQIHKRKSLRLQGFDYSCAGLYFITICTEMRAPLFGEIVRPLHGAYQQMQQSPAGRIVQQTWLNLPQHNNHICLHEFVLMPDHVHGIIEITNSHRSLGLTEIIRQFKTFSARKINSTSQSHGEKIWQRGFHDHIIKNEIAYSQITEYIRNNHQKWSNDT